MRRTAPLGPKGRSFHYQPSTGPHSAAPTRRQLLLSCQVGRLDGAQVRHHGTRQAGTHVAHHPAIQLHRVQEWGG